MFFAFVKMACGLANLNLNKAGRFVLANLNLNKV